MMQLVRLLISNGLTRLIFPLGTHFADLTDRDIARVMSRLNHQPRKRMGFSLSDISLRDESYNYELNPSIIIKISGGFRGFS